jgi:hypothetical protein
MKTHTVLTTTLLVLLAAVTAQAQPPQTTRMPPSVIPHGFVSQNTNYARLPEHAVLFVIDGLSYKVWDRLLIPTLRGLARDGALIEKDYLPPPADPRRGGIRRIA